MEQAEGPTEGVIGRAGPAAGADSSAPQLHRGGRQDLPGRWHPGIPATRGCGIITPIKKKPGVERAEADKEFNTGVARLRVGVERGIAHLKNWRILATRYRGDLSRLNTLIAAVTGPQMLNEMFLPAPLPPVRRQASREQMRVAGVLAQ
ncbi:MAG TPA: transposase family protein [Pseudonocardiaceae bacterium]|nr:transposase family protein [Pseudonocardiaceae bacterium]